MQQKRSSSISEPSRSKSPKEDPQLDVLLLEAVNKLQCVIDIDPKRFTGLLSEKSQVDVRGFRKLLSKIPPQSHKFFKGNLSGPFINAIKNSKETPLRDMDFISWSESLIERIGLGTIEDISYYESTIGEAKIRDILSIGNKNLLDYALSKRTGPVMKLVFDILQPVDRKLLLSQLNSNDWEKLVGERFCSPNEILIVAQELIESSFSSESQLDLPPSFLNTALEIMLEADFSEEQNLLESMLGSNPELKRDLLSRFVPLHSLQNVDSSIKKASFLALSNSVKINVLAGFPETERAKYTAFLPEGNLKILVLDGLKKASSNQSAQLQYREEAKKFVQSFLGVILSVEQDKGLKLAS